MFKIDLIIGAKNSGKSFFIKDRISNLHTDNVIVFDVEMESLYEDYQTISPNEIIKNSSSKKDILVKRVIPIIKNAPMTFSAIRNTVKKLILSTNGVLVLENISKYADKHLYEIICKPDNNLLHIICVFNNFSSIPKQLLSIANTITLHRPNAIFPSDIDDVVNGLHKDARIILKLALCIVKNKVIDDRFFNVTINQFKTISGKFDKSDYRNACMDLLISANALDKYSPEY